MLEVRDNGVRSGPTIVLLHGARHAAWCWESALAWFAERGRRAVAPSFRGHGTSGGVLEGASLADYADDVRSLIDEQTVLVGHSLGGAVAQKIAETSQLHALVLVSSVPPAGVTPEDDAHLEATVPGALEHVKRFFATRDGFPRELFLADASDAVAARLAERLGPASAVAQAELRRGIVERPASMPVAVIAGERDAFLPPAAHERTRAFYGAPPIHWLRGGHDLMLEPSAPELFALILRDAS
jgi:pimeloyl-ACP methyl ester carboxylesterase